MHVCTYMCSSSLMPWVGQRIACRSQASSLPRWVPEIGPRSSVSATRTFPASPVSKFEATIRCYYRGNWPSGCSVTILGGQSKRELKSWKDSKCFGPCLQDKLVPDGKGTSLKSHMDHRGHRGSRVWILFKTGLLCVALVSILELALVDQAGLEPQTHRDPPASASRVLGLMVCATTAPGF